MARTAGRGPGLRTERSLHALGQTRIVGVDEVGLGALAGPVIAAAVLVLPGARRVPGVRDSKALTPGRRAELAAEIVARAAAVGVGAASVTEIERWNVRRASHLAMLRALRRLPAYDHVLVDGRAIAGFAALAGPTTAIVRGDATVYSIACASIVAKVVRDRLMDRLAARYPVYGWERNAGYGTPDHLAALGLHGASVVHRRGFAPVRAVLGDPAGAEGGEQLGLDLGALPPAWTAGDPGA
ncbi:MAG: ribonuclease HII [Chloroflexota bacterium]